MGKFLHSSSTKIVDLKTMNVLSGLVEQKADIVPRISILVYKNFKLIFRNYDIVLVWFYIMVNSVIS